MLTSTAMLEDLPRERKSSSESDVPLVTIMNSLSENSMQRRGSPLSMKGSPPAITNPMTPSPAAWLIRPLHCEISMSGRPPSPPDRRPAAEA